MKVKKDRYFRSRGGIYTLLDIYCENCSEKMFTYQKDGGGNLHRLYVDRIQPLVQETLEGRCGNCGRLFGIVYIYKKELRPAIRLSVNSIKTQRV